MRTLLWSSLLLAGAIVLWRAGLALSHAAPAPVDHGDRLVFGLIVTVGVGAFVVAAERIRLGQPPWVPLRKIAFAQAGAGFVGYAAAAAGAVLALMLFGLVDIEISVSQEAAFSLAYLLALVLLSEALPEELLFRGWLMQRLAAFRSPWLTVLGQAALFSLFAWAVGAVTSVADLSFIFSFGVVLGIVRAATGTIWASVGVHLAFITAQQSALPQWALWTGDPHTLAQVAGLTILPFSVIVAVLFDRVGRRFDQTSAA